MKKYQKKICNSCEHKFVPNGGSQRYCKTCKDKKIVFSQRGKREFLKYILQSVLDKKIISCPEGELCRRRNCIFSLKVVETYNQLIQINK